MIRISDCTSHSDYLDGHYTAKWTDPRSGMSITVKSKRPLVFYGLDDSCWQVNLKRPDGLIIAELDDGAYPIFLELKGRIGEEDRPFRQIENGIRHFCKDDVHGVDHHVQWKDGSDLPEFRRKRRKQRINPEADHRVAGVVMTSRGGSRTPPRLFSVAGKEIVVGVWQRHGSYHSCEVELETLLSEAGVQ